MLAYDSVLYKTLELKLITSGSSFLWKFEAAIPGGKRRHFDIEVNSWRQPSKILIAWYSGESCCFEEIQVRLKLGNTHEIPSSFKAYTFNNNKHVIGIEFTYVPVSHEIFYFYKTSSCI